MNLAVVTMVGRRYSQAKAGDGFVSLVSVVSFLGLVLGVIALVVVVSVMNGFDRELKQRILGAIPHLVVANAEVSEVTREISDLRLSAATPFLEQEILVMTNRGSQLLSVYGIESALEAAASTIPAAMIDGSLDALTPGSLSIVMGKSVSRRIGIIRGDTVNLILPTKSASGQLIKPKLVKATMAGSFALGSELDYSLAVMNLDDLLAMTGRSKAVRITFTDLFDANTAAIRLEAAGMKVSIWTGRYGDFFKTVRMEKIMMYVLLSFVIAIASFSIVSGLTMLVSAKRRDIAVLRTMGLSENGVMSVFLFQGVTIAFAGVAIGLLIGVPLAYYVPDLMGYVERWFGFSIIEGTYFDTIPTDVRALDILVICSITICISLLATIYPAWRAARLNPAAILRYE